MLSITLICRINFQIDQYEVYLMDGTIKSQNVVHYFTCEISTKICHVKNMYCKAANILLYRGNIYIYIVHLLYVKEREIDL